MLGEIGCWSLFGGQRVNKIFLCYHIDLLVPLVCKVIDYSRHKNVIQTLVTLSMAPCVGLVDDFSINIVRCIMQIIIFQVELF